MTLEKKFHHSEMYMCKYFVKDEKYPFFEDIKLLKCGDLTLIFNTLNINTRQFWKLCLDYSKIFYNLFL